MLKASSAIPLVCHPYKVNDIEYFDGALSDILPVQRVLINNADKIVLILKTPGYTKKQYKRYQNCLNDQ